MPAVGGPGKDAITGDRYTMDLGVEPDLGNLLQNMTVANQLADQMEKKFLTINTAVASTTQKMTALTRATEMTVAQTGRLLNQYQTLASMNIGAGMNIPPVGAAMGAMPGMGAYSMAGYGAGMGGGGYGGGLPRGNDWGGRGGGHGGGGGSDEDIPEVDVAPGRGEMPSGQQLVSRVADYAILGKSFIHPHGRVASAFKLGRAAGGPMGLGSMAKAVEKLGPEVETAAGVTSSAGFLGGMKGMAGMAALAGRFANPVTAGISGAIAAYKLIDNINKGAIEYSGLTGGTSVNEYGSMQLRKWTRGLTSLGVGPAAYEEMMKRTLGAGYQQGKGREADITGWLLSNYKKGLTDIAGNLDMYQEAVDKAGAGTTQLSGALDGLRNVALSSDASLQVMMSNFRSQLESLTTMGMSGPSAIRGAYVSSTAYAGSSNPAVRAFGGPDFSNMYQQILGAQALGVGYAQLPYAMNTNPNAGNIMAVASEEQAIQFLTSWGYTADMTPQEILAHSAAGGGGGPAILPNGAGMGEFFKTLGFTSPELSGDALDMASWVQMTLSRPVQNIIQKDEEWLAGSGISITEGTGEVTNAIQVGGTKLNITGTPSDATQGELLEAGAQEYVFGGGGLGLEQGQSANKYADIIAEGGRTIPLLERYIKSGEINHTYIDTPEGTFLASMALQTHPEDVVKAFAGEEGYTIATMEGSWVEKEINGKTKKVWQANEGTYNLGEGGAASGSAIKGLEWSEANQLVNNAATTDEWKSVGGKGDYDWLEGGTDGGMSVKMFAQTRDAHIAALKYFEHHKNDD